MRSILLLGIAAGTMMAAVQAPALARDQGPRLDYGVPASTDARVYTGYPDRVPSEVDYRYVDNGYNGQPGVGYSEPPPAYDPYYDNRQAAPVRQRHASDYDRDMERRCGQGGQIGGAVVGGAVGAIAGNRIAGRGNRTAGTLIGGGVGALAGAAVGNASDRKRCDEWRANRSRYQQGYSQGYQGGYYAPAPVPAPVAPPPPPAYYGAPYGGTTVYQQGGYGAVPYGYYSPGVVVTTVITQGAPVITETIETTTTTSYENVPVRTRYVAKPKPKKVWRPKPKAKPRCVC